MVYGEAYKQLTNIKIAFHHIEEDMMNKLTVTLIILELEYEAWVFSIQEQKTSERLSKYKRGGTKMVTSLKDLPNEERLKRIGANPGDKRGET